MADFPPKRPDEILDYEVDWSARIGLDTATATRVDVIGVTKVSQSLVGSVTRMRLSGGTAGVDANIIVELDVQSGQLYETEINLPIRD
jgi:hypothetical protein